MKLNSKNPDKVGLTQKEQFMEAMAIGLALLLLLGSAIKVLFI